MCFDFHVFVSKVGTDDSLGLHHRSIWTRWDEDVNLEMLISGNDVIFGTTVNNTYINILSDIGRESLFLIHGKEKHARSK